jgi:hypothetical protein
MANVYHVVRPSDFILPTTNTPVLGKVVHATAGSGVVETLSYDASTKEYGYFTYRATQYNAGSDVKVDIDWYAATNGVSGVVRWEGAVGAITANVDLGNVPDVGLGPNVSTTTSCSNQRLFRSTLTFTGSALDGMSSEDYVTVKVARDAANGGDTLATDANIVMATVYYTGSGLA